MSLPSSKKRKIFDGRYEIIALVGRGSDSVVYHARHISSASHEVALKVLHNQQNRASLSDRLRKEALTLVSCRHKFVVRLDDFHSVQDLCYLSMEYAPLGDLRKYITALGTALPVDQGRVFLRQSLEAIDFVHATGVIHRDMKPDNILVVTEKDIRLADFGMALLPGDDIDLEDLKRGAGSFSYLPPELLEGIGYDTRSDIYGLGLCFYEALAGFHPFEKLPLAEQAEARLDGHIPMLHEINPAVPTGLSHVIATMMRYSPEQRFQTATQALRALADPEFTGLSQSATQPMSPSNFDPFLDGDGDFDFIPNNYSHQSDEDIMDVTAHNLVEEALDTEGAFAEDENIDSPSAASRDRQRTEELDLESVKTLAGHGAASIPTSSQRNADNVDTNKQAADRFLDSDQREHRFPLPGSLSPREPSSPQAGKRAAAPITVALGAALVTIVVVAMYSRFVGSETTSLDSETEQEQVAEHVEGEETRATQASTANSEQLPTNAQNESFFPRLGQGLYSGTITEILPETSNPIAFLSIPHRKSIAVIIGIPGWTPVEVPVPDTRIAGAETITVRSNGLILSLTGELSGEAITGTFTNVVTGDSGTWSAKLVK